MMIYFLAGQLSGYSAQSFRQHSLFIWQGTNINIQLNNEVDVSQIENQNDRESEWKKNDCLENLFLTTLAN